MTYLFPPSTPTSVPITSSSERFPIHRIYCVGRNYADHAKEMGTDPSREAPFFFTKPADALVVDGVDIDYPSKTNELHHEIELVVAVGKGGFNIPVETAEGHIYGYAVGLDLTRRDLQAQAKSKSHPWCTSKAFDQSAVIAAITPRCDPTNEEATALDIAGANISLTINDQIRQSGNTQQMIWSVAEIVSTLSEFFVLAPGDLIYTGTPAGVGSLNPGDEMLGEISGLTPLTAKILPSR